MRLHAEGLQGSGGTGKINHDDTRRTFARMLYAANDAKDHMSEDEWQNYMEVTN